MERFPIVSYHTNTWGCGIAKYNSILADKLQLPIVSFAEFVNKAGMPFILSISLREFSQADKSALANILEKDVQFILILHTFEEDPIELKAIRKSRGVFTLNSEITKLIQKRGERIYESFAPSMLIDSNEDSQNKFRLFTFGMGHKFHFEQIKKLTENFRSLEIEPKIYISIGIHVGEQPLDRVNDEVNDFMRELKMETHFLGFLSDYSLRKEMLGADGIFRFFPKGVRSNSTSLMTALELGKLTITNLDQHSPRWLVHKRNIIDIEQWRMGEALPQNIGEKAREDYSENCGWDKSVTEFRAFLSEVMS